MSDAIKLGRFSSWTVVSPNVIIKHGDISAFENHGSALDARTRVFWNVQDLSYPKQHEIVLRYKGKDYKTRITIDNINRTRIFWTIELQNLFKLQYHSEEQFPDIRFERVGNDIYEVTFINIPYIEDEEPNELESVVEDVVSGQEGKRIRIYTTKYERNPQNRKVAIKIHGTKCMVCGFDFESTYGDLGKNFIEVHHIKPLFSLEEETEVNPETDLVCVCSNCHRMIHRKRDTIISVEELRKLITK